MQHGNQSSVPHGRGCLNVFLKLCQEIWVSPVSTGPEGAFILSLEVRYPFELGGASLEFH